MKRLIMMMVASAFLPGCTMFTVEMRTSKIPVSLTPANGEYESLGGVTIRHHSIFNFTRNFDVGEGKPVEPIPNGTDAIVNSKVVMKYTFGDFWINVLTLGIAQSYHFEVKGEAVDMKP